MLQAIDTLPTPTVLPENAFFGRIVHMRYDLLRMAIIMDNPETRDSLLSRWLTVFLHAQIFVLDATGKPEFVHPRVRTMAANPKHLEHIKLFRTWLVTPMDVIIDARVGQPQEQQTLLSQLWSAVKARGFYIIEDTHAPEVPSTSTHTDDLLFAVRQALVWGLRTFPDCAMPNAEDVFAEMAGVDLYRTSVHPGPLALLQRRADFLSAMDLHAAARATAAHAKGPVDALPNGQLAVPRAVGWEEVDRTLERFSWALLRLFGGAVTPNLEVPMRSMPHILLGAVTEGKRVRLYMCPADGSAPHLYLEQLTPAHRVQALDTVPDLMDLAIYHVRLREAEMLHIVQNVNRDIDRLAAFGPGAVAVNH